MQEANGTEPGFVVHHAIGLSIRLTKKGRTQTAEVMLSVRGRDIETGIKATGDDAVEVATKLVADKLAGLA